MRGRGLDLVALAAGVERLAASAPLVGAATPSNLDAELARLRAARAAGARLAPAFVYASRPIDEGAVDTLDQLADQLAPLGGPALALVDRAREVALELRIAIAVGTPALRALAAQRFTSDARDDARARAWAALDVATGLGALSSPDAAAVPSCDEGDPRSLVSAMRSAIGERRLPVRVVLRGDMASLAATGDGVVFVARGRLLDDRDVKRTVLHEVDGHVAPWAARRAKAPPGARVAGEVDAEEGRALLLEHRAGLLDARRRKQLGLRHEAARMAHEGAGFVEIALALEALGATPHDAIGGAARALRGGGLGRERVYLPWLWRLRRGEPMPTGEDP